MAVSVNCAGKSILESWAFQFKGKRLTAVPTSIKPMVALQHKWKVQSSRVKTGNKKKKNLVEKQQSWGPTVVGLCYLLSESVGEVPPPPVLAGLH